MNDRTERKKMSATKKILLALAAVAAAAVLFFAGFFTYYFTLPAGARSLLWFKDKIDSEYYENIDDEDFWQAAIDGAQSLLDRYSAYYTAEEYDSVVNSSQGLYVGTGLSFFSGTNKIADVAYNSPAFYANETADSEKFFIETGLFVTGVGASADAVQDTFAETSGGAVDYSRLGALLGSFGEGDTVWLRLSSVSGTDTQNCTLVPVSAGSYNESYVLYVANGTAWTNVYSGGASVWTDVSEYVSLGERFGQSEPAYIRLSSFYGNAVAEFRLAAEQYKKDGKGGLLLDLRNDGGGRVDIMQGIASYLMKDAKSDSEPVMTAEYKSGRKEIYLAGGNFYGDYFADGEIYVAANKNTASASEALMGAMISYGTIGYENVFITDTNWESQATNPHSVTTYGKGIMQTTFSNFFTGEAVKLTTATIHWPDEKSTCIHGRGISTEDGAVATQNAQTFGDYGDPELDFILGYIAR